MSNRFNNNLMLSVITLIFSVFAPFIPFKNQMLAVSAGLAGGFTGGSIATILLTKRSQNESQDFNSSEVDSQNENIELNASEAKTVESSSLVLPVISWLQERQIEVVNQHQPTEADVVWNRLARYRGKNNSCEELVQLHNHIRKSAAQKIDFSYNLLGKSQQAIAACAQYCTLLNEAGLLSSYRYNSKPKIIRGRAIDTPEVVLFLNGGWLERFVAQIVINNLRHLGKVDYLMNPKVRFPNLDLYELDLLVTVNDQQLWIESKSGNHWNDYLPKYCSRREVLGVDKNKAFLVGLELTEQSAKDKTAMYGITVTTLDNLLTKIEEALKA